MHSNSRKIISNQGDVHPNLESILSRYSSSQYLAPISELSLRTFELIYNLVEDSDKPIIMDSGCGTGDSTVSLAKLFPDHLVIGLDKSKHRLSKVDQKYKASNAIFLRANLPDIWRLFEEYDMRVAFHFLLYQNPWPKKHHLKRRWHAHPSFSSLLNISDQVVMRTNWELYAKEFCLAVKTLKNYEIKYSRVINRSPLSAFEAKFFASNLNCYEASVNLVKADPPATFSKSD